MKGFLIIALLTAPGAVLAQDRAEMCVSVLDAMDALSHGLDGLTDQEADQHADLLAMRERIGGSDGAAVEAKAEAHLAAYLDARKEVTDAADDARSAIMAYCAP